MRGKTYELPKKHKKTLKEYAEFVTGDISVVSGSFDHLESNEGQSITITLPGIPVPLTQSLVFQDGLLITSSLA